MKITPLDVGSHRFPKKWRGYDMRDVEIFLEMVSQEMEEIIQENQFLSEELRRKSSELSEFKEKEQLLKDAMITAQRVAEDMKAHMEKEAQVVVARAELEADQIVAKAHERLMGLQAEIREMKEERIRLREEMRGVLKTYNALLDAGEVRAEEEDRQAYESTIRVMPKVAHK